MSDVEHLDERKRTADSDSDDVGPQIPTNLTSHEKHPKKRIKSDKNLALYMDKLPSAAKYEKSLMHRDVCNLVQVAPQTDFVITTSIDGHVKFWKKPSGKIQNQPAWAGDLGVLEFVKHFKAHLGAVVGLDISFDGTLAATIAVDKTLKVFDVVNFDMINMFKLDFLPRSVAWCHQTALAQSLVLVSDRETSKIYVFDARASDATPLYTVDMHKAPVHLLRYNALYNVVISLDQSGGLEYWVPEKDGASFGRKPEASDGVAWEFKSETDLFEFKKVVPNALAISPDGQKFATFSWQDRQVRVFSFPTGKLLRTYDESLGTISEMQQAGTAAYTLDDQDFNRRKATEHELEQNPLGGQAATCNLVFDESSTLLLYPTLLGIKVVDVVANRVVRVIGKGESLRFCSLALYQGQPRKKAITTVEMAASENPAFKDAESRDPTLFCTAFKKNRFYLFTRRVPMEENTRDVFNEKPAKEDQVAAQASKKATKPALPTHAILRTTLGDIHLELYPQHAPKAVENFAGLAKKGYYDNVIFHRVIPSFMIQTGDPLGDGTGGESLWGKPFEDEFTSAVRHDKPFTLSMANAGPTTNGSQFFITTVPTPWLDNKHTIFGRATAGMDVIKMIEGLRTNKADKPHDAPKILSIQIK